MNLSESPTPAACRLPLEQARRILLVRAFEEADARDELVPRHERWRVTEEARSATIPDGTGPPSAAEAGTFLDRRATGLLPLLRERTGVVDALERATRLHVTPWAVVLVAFVVGLASNLLGPSKRVNVVANPLAGLVLWNLLVLLALVVSSVLGKARGSAPGRAAHPLVRRVAELVMHLRTRVAAGANESPAVAAGTGAFLGAWRRHAGPVLALGVRRLLHVGALSMVLGALASLYVRGLVLEYRATWESTFVSADTMSAFLHALFAPAALLGGPAVPAPETIQAMQAPEAGPAAVWIHLWAVTTLAFVIVPRAGLALALGARLRRASRAVELDLDCAYYRRLLRSSRAAGARVELVPYGHRSASTASESLKTLVYEVLGPRTQVVLQNALEYGAEASEVELPTAEDEPQELWVVPIFGLSQTPEAEVHGRFAADLEQRLGERGRIFALVDASTWNASHGADSERTPERRKSWERVLRDAGTRALHVDLGAAIEQEAIDALTLAVGDRKPTESAEPVP